MQKSPLAIVKERFGDKAGLVKAIEGLTKDDALWLDRVNSSKGLSCVSNRKLLHLHAVLTEVQSQFGGRDALISAILDVEGRNKDEHSKTSLVRMPTPKLFDRYRSSKKRSATAQAA